MVEQTQETVTNIMHVMQQREEVAYEAGVKDTLKRILPNLIQLQNIINLNVKNVQETLELDRLVKIETTIPDEK